MSSIYRKGRDGYYYYQTYVYNTESQKKDKKVFHSLGTKDLAEAQTKQHELDLQYEKQKNNNNLSSSSPFTNLINTQTIIVIFFTIIVTTMLNLYFFSNSIKRDVVSALNIEKIEIETEAKIKPELIEPIKTLTKTKNKNEEINQTQEIKPFHGKNNERTIPLIPEYKIERVEKLSSSFAQGKVYVTIDINTSNESQRLLCENLTERYSEFSNIMICLYANGQVGKNIANGINETVTIQEQKQFWLAMYTYNKVEGAYFDDNPTGYLGYNN
ncbi:MAG: hypothetical protein CMG60_07090 [Candidatus Marinimicrobia bacterium]|nr:hypothetical protein [Candidatus Neomarinimicrobiota bacterium]|tara:strand:+ start:439 stop:1251 length:813 start_codon:yes stop_codon:yes gene_type:complete